MTAEEKALELFNKMYNVDCDDDIDDMQYGHAKKCAIIAVDDILNNFGTLTEGKQHYAAYSTIKFYEEVKREIIKL